MYKAQFPNPGVTLKHNVFLNLLLRTNQPRATVPQRLLFMPSMLLHTSG